MEMNFCEIQSNKETDFAESGISKEKLPPCIRHSSMYTKEKLTYTQNEFYLK